MKIQFESLQGVPEGGECQKAKSVLKILDIRSQVTSKLPLQNPLTKRLLATFALYKCLFCCYLFFIFLVKNNLSRKSRTLQFVMNFFGVRTNFLRENRVDFQYQGLIV